MTTIVTIPAYGITSHDAAWGAYCPSNDASRIGGYICTAAKYDGTIASIVTYNLHKPEGSPFFGRAVWLEVDYIPSSPPHNHIWFDDKFIPETTYYYVAWADGIYGEVLSWTSLVPPGFLIITLSATEVWATGATVHGMLENKGLPAYAYAGFQWGPNSDVSAEVIHWSYSGSYGYGKVPIQATISGLLPDRTYYYRACLHEGTPPMSVGNIFGSTLSFGGPVSIFGHGWEYVTAKKAEDDVSKLAAGRYYMDKSGNFVYESAKHRVVP